jgi:hypothetical protein
MALVSMAGTIGAAVLVIDRSDEPESFPRGMYAAFGDEEWTEDYDAVMAMLAGESPDARAYPVESLNDADLPDLPKELQGLLDG